MGDAAGRRDAARPPAAADAPASRRRSPPWRWRRLAIYFAEKIAPVLSLGVVYLPAVAAHLDLLGPHPRAPDLAVERGGVQLLPPAAGRPVRRSPTPATGWRWPRSRSSPLVASTIAELARSRAMEAERRRAEADLAAALARELLLGVDTGTALASAARRVAEALALPSAAIEPGIRRVSGRRPRAPASRRRRQPGGDAHRARAICPATPSSACARRWCRRSRRWSRIAQRRDALQAERGRDRGAPPLRRHQDSAAARRLA